jgi:hypothetical protein
MKAEEKSEERQYSYALKSEVGQDSLHSGYLVLREIQTDLNTPSMYGIRIPIPGKYNGSEELAAAGRAVFVKFNKGTATTESIPKLQEKLKGYRLTGTARFQIIDLKWEPVLEIKNMEGANRGLRQTVIGGHTPFTRNLFRSPDSAAQFALDYGKQMVNKTVGGLEI